MAQQQTIGVQIHLPQTAEEREKIGPDVLKRMADVFDGPEAER